MNISNVDIIFVRDSLFKSRKGGITGILYFDFGNYQFPEKNWSDFVPIILGWWLTAFNNLISRSTASIDLHFMDGPLLIRLKSNQKEALEIECIEKGKKEKIEHSTFISLNNFCQKLIKVSEELLDQTIVNNWNSDDLTLVSGELAKLKGMKKI